MRLTKVLVAPMAMFMTFFDLCKATCTNRAGGCSSSAVNRSSIAICEQGYRRGAGRLVTNVPAGARPSVGGKLTLQGRGRSPKWEAVTQCSERTSECKAESEAREGPSQANSGTAKIAVDHSGRSHKGR